MEILKTIVFGIGDVEAKADFPLSKYARKANAYVSFFHSTKTTHRASNISLSQVFAHITLWS